MSKRFSVVITSLALTCSLGIVACGGSPAETTSDTRKEETVESTVSEPESANPAEKFVGSWKLAQVESNGVTMVGSFQSLFDTEEGMALVISADGTGRAVMGNNEDDGDGFTWELKDDNTIAMTPSSSDSDSPLTSADITYDEKDASLTLKMVQDGTEMSVVFTANGTLASLPEFDLNKAAAVTSIDQITGEWEICGLGANGMTAFGDADTLNQMMGDSFDPNITINADGTMVMDGSEGATVTVDENGATMNDAYSTASLKLLDSNLVLDMSDMMGGVEFFMLYTK